MILICTNKLHVHQQVIGRTNIAIYVVYNCETCADDGINRICDTNYHCIWRYFENIHSHRECSWISVYDKSNCVDYNICLPLAVSYHLPNPSLILPYRNKEKTVRILRWCQFCHWKHSLYPCMWGMCERPNQLRSKTVLMWE